MAEHRQRVLVVGGSHAEIPLIGAAHRLGCHVTTTGNRPHDLGHAHADRYVSADFSDREAITRLAAELEVTAIISGCNDFAALSSAAAAEALGLPGHDSYETALRIHHKDRFRELLADVGVPSPLSGVVTSVADAHAVSERIGLPVIVKPVDLTGGKGINVCHTTAELDAAVTSALAITRQPHVVLEQFLIGTRHGFTCIVADGRVGFWFADDEQYYRNPYLVSGTTTPTSMPSAAVRELVDAVERIVDHLHLVDGLMHVQCMLTGAGPRIIELCRRCPGDLYPRFVELSTGFDYARAVVSSEMGLPTPTPPPWPTKSITRHCLMGDREGVLVDVCLPHDLQSSVIDQLLWWKPGQQVENHLSDKFGIVFFGFDEVAAMRATTSTLPDRIVVNFREGQE